MTYSKALYHAGRPRQSRTVLEAYTLEAERLCEVLGVDGRERWPDPKYRNDPHGFFRDVLGVEPWGDDSHGQHCLLNLIRDNWRVAVRAGRKVSKSMTDAGVALWWYSCWYDAQVVMSSTTARQVDEILWEELRKLHDSTQRPIDPIDDRQAAIVAYAASRGHAVSTRPIDGEPRVLARSGLVSGFRRVAGFTAREGVAAQGKSGAHLLYLVDEASGVAQSIFTAIKGNMAASGCKLVISGNPTTSEGEFYDAFNANKQTPDNPRGYACLTISSEESPNVVQRRDVIPGLAGLEFIQDREREWGRESAEFKVHVLGQHVEFEEGKIISLAMIKEAEELWKAKGESAVPADGLLHVGVDPAVAEDGDEAVFVPRRGKRILELRCARGLKDEEGHLAVLLDLLGQYRQPGEYAVVNLDSLGDVGAKVYYRLRDYAEKHPDVFYLCPLRASDNPAREPEGYLRVYDLLWGVMAQWLQAGGAIPEDLKLARDLHAPSWKWDKASRKMATRKDELRKKLKRSPDRGNAACLACYDNTNAAQEAQLVNRMHAEQKQQRASILDEPAANGMDPFAGQDQWR